MIRLAALIRLLLITLLGCASAPATPPEAPPATAPRGSCEFAPTGKPTCPMRGICRSPETHKTVFILMCDDDAAPGDAL